MGHNTHGAKGEQITGLSYQVVPLLRCRKVSRLPALLSAFVTVTDSGTSKRKRPNGTVRIRRTRGREMVLKGKQRSPSGPETFQGPKIYSRVNSSAV